MDQKEPEGKANLASGEGVSSAYFQQHARDSRRSRDRAAVNCHQGSHRTGPNESPGHFRLLRKLRPRQERVIRLYFGLGCERPHSAREMAEEFGVSVQVIAGLLGAAQRRLGREGLTSIHLREAARPEAELRYAPPSVTESTSHFRRGSHWHRRL